MLKHTTHKHIALFAAAAIAVGCGVSNPVDPLVMENICGAEAPSAAERERYETCSAALPGGTLTASDAQGIGGRTWHELLHIRSLLLDGSNQGLYSWIEADQTRFEGTTDSGFALGNVTSETAGGVTTHCAQVHFGCWTGGHGGFGAVALEGDVNLELVVSADSTTLRASGLLGLLEGGALLGAPESSVEIYSTASPDADDAMPADETIIGDTL